MVFFCLVSADSYLFVSGARAEEAVLRGGKGPRSLRKFAEVTVKPEVMLSLL